MSSPLQPTPSSPVAIAAELRAGTVLSHYRVQERIGRGGMGTVYRAHDSRLARDVAIKVVNEDAAWDAERVARFHREARTLAALNHPGIVVVHDTGQERGLNYLVTELIDGVTLRALIADEGALGSRRTIEIGAQVADALAAAHALGVMHRDLKPENVMLTRQGRAKLLDFGLARPSRNDVPDETRTALQTDPGIAMGTVQYMSPEQIRGEALDSRSDIFSLGVVLHEMLSGARPFQGATQADVLSAVLRGEPPPLPDSIHPALRQVVERCLNRQPADRFQSASDLGFALRNAAAASGRVEIEAARSRVRPLWWVAGVLLAGGAGLSALGLARILAEPAAAPPLRLRPFATEAYGESQPLWSPDGRSLAYVAAIDGAQNLFVKGLENLSPVHVLRCPAICDTVGWSDDGSRILYMSRTTHLDARLWSVARTGGDPVPVFETDVQLLAASVAPGGKRLALLRVVPNPTGPGQMYGLFLSDPPGAEPVRFEPFPLRNLITPTRMAWSPDGTRLLAFSSGPALLHLVSLTARSHRTMPALSRMDISWGTDPSFAIAARPSTTATRTGLEWLDIETGTLRPLISSEAMLSFPALSPSGSSAAYTVGENDFDLLEIPLDGSPIRPLLASRLPEHSVHYSPRTDEFAYTAAGEEPEIRVRQPATLSERVVVSRADFPDQPGPSRFAAVAFSPDGTKIAYNREFSIWISPSNGGAPAKLTREPGEFAAEWSPDGAWIAFNYARPFFGGLVKVRVGAGEAEVRLRPGICGPVAPAWSPDGAWIACGREPMGLDLVPAGGGSVRFLGGQYEPIAAWSRDPNRLYVIRASEGRRELGELSWRTGVFRRISDLPPDFVISNGISWGGRLSLSRDGKSLVTAVTRATGDIWIVNGLRPPTTWWQRVLGR
ncbi:MAG TPA: protein kinase [Vicinamibacterales bacterium]|nr:protein kinase [Vicinamibacterales bacterium]